VRSFVRAWNRFWFREVDGRPLAAVRIGTAVAGLFVWIETAPLLSTYYVETGEFPLEGARSWSTEWVSRFAMPEFLGSLEAVVTLFAILLGFLVALLVGVGTRVAAWGAWALVVWFQYRNPTFLNGGDEILRLTLFYLALGYTVVRPGERVWTLDRRWAPGGREGGRKSGRERVPVWTLRLIQIQVALVYFVSGFWKVLGQGWWNGEAVYYALGNESFTRFGLPEWSGLQPLFVVVGLAVAWWEVLFPLLVGWSRSRIPALLFGVALHTGIFLAMNIGVFAFIMLATYPAFLTRAPALTEGEAPRLSVRPAPALRHGRSPP